MKVGNTSEKEIERKFDIAVQLVKSLPQSSSFSPSYSEATKIYSYFKQSKFGVCSIPRPGFWDVVNRTKWDAWSALGDMPAQDAMNNYVEAIKGVYNRIKDIDAFEVRHHEFANTLIPFCKETGIPLTSKLMEIVKSNQMNGENEDIHKVNGLQPNGEVNGNSHSDVNDASHIEVNGIITNGLLDESLNSSANDDSSASVEINRITKSVKFQINNDKEDVDEEERHSENDLNVEVKVKFQISNDQDEVDEEEHHSENDLNVEVNNEDKSEKEEGELSSSSADSDDGEIYCDSIDPGQILEVAATQAQLDPNESSLGIARALPVSVSLPFPPIISESTTVVSETIPVVATETVLFSPILSTNTFQDTTAQNILTKSTEHSHSSSNNSRSDFELVDMSMNDRKNFQCVRKQDCLLPCSNIEIPGDKGQSREKSSEKNDMQCSTCHCGVRSHKKKGHHSSHRQHHSKHGNSKHAQNNAENSNNENNASSNNDSNDHHSHRRQHNSHNRRSNSDGSNYGGSRDDSGGSTSSSSSDSIGLKIVKALERMDDNMHLILNRLNSIDTSMKTLAKLPPQPWWVKHIPSKFVISTALWPIIINLLFYYFWQRRRRRQQLRFQKHIATANLKQT